MAVRKSPSEEYQQSAVVIVDNGGVEERVNLRVLSNKAIKALAKDSGLKVKATKKQDMIDEIMNQAAGSKLTIQNEEPDRTGDGAVSQKNKENYAGVIITNKDGNEEEINLYSMEKQAVKKLATDSGLRITAEDKDSMIQEMMKQINEAYQSTEERNAEDKNEGPPENTLSENEVDNSGKEKSAQRSSSFLEGPAYEHLVRDMKRTLTAKGKDEMERGVKKELKQQVKNDFMEHSWDALMKEIKADAEKNGRNEKKASSIKFRADK